MQAEKYSAKNAIKDFWGEELKRFKELLPRGRLLEIGSGDGRDAQELIKLGYDYFGTDISSGLLQLARKNNPGARFEKVSLYDLNYDELFDGFWCAHVLLHIPREKIDQALMAIKKNIKNGAFGFISIKEGEGEQLESKAWLSELDKLYFVFCSDDDFSKKLANNGFKIIDQGYRHMTNGSNYLTYIVQVSK